MIKSQRGDRLIKRTYKLSGSLEKHERAVFLLIFQYLITQRKEALSRV